MRKSNLRSVACTAAFLSLLLTLPFHQSSSAAKGPTSENNQFEEVVSPNIIFILTDDLDANSIAFMPKLQSLVAERGAKFTSFFTGLSLCCPSRASVLRGQYAHNHQVLNNKPPTGGFPTFRDMGLESSTIGVWLQSIGYHTVYIGKYFNGYPDGDPTYVPVGWSEWFARVDDTTGTKYFGYKLNQNGRIVSYGDKDEDYITDVETEKAIDSMQRASRTGRPFFLYLAVNAPHKPPIPAPRHKNAFPGIKAPRSLAFNEQDVSDKPGEIRELPLLSSDQVKKIDRLYRRRLQTMLAVDDMIGSLIAELETLGKLDQTYIFFTSDNGFSLGEHRLSAGKGKLYEVDIRVPMIVRGPGIPAGRMIDELSGNVDLAPTIAELVGVPAPLFVDGRSLAKLLKSERSEVVSWRNAFLLERFFPASRRGKGLRTKLYRYVEYGDGERELYNLRDDPQELINVYRSADRSLIDELSFRLAALSNCRGQECRDAEEKPLVENFLAER